MDQLCSGSLKAMSTLRLEAPSRIAHHQTTGAILCLTVGGTSQFQEVIVNQNLSVAGSEFIGIKRADANHSLNIIGEKEFNFSIQTDRGIDPTNSSIALQLKDNPAGITMNRATTVNQTLHVIGNTTAEANLHVWGDVFFQHSSAFFRFT